MPSTEKIHVLAIDPGRDKIGLAVLSARGDIEEKLVVFRGEFEHALRRTIGEYSIDRIVIGGGTGSDWVKEQLERHGVESVIEVGEEGTTLEARELAWKENPPSGLWKLLPKLFRPTPRDMDAWAAVVIGRRAIGEGM